MLLYFAPGSCSRVSLMTLLETGAAFDTSLMRFMKGQHKSPAYRALNPKGKVPLLTVDGAPLTENVAIVSFLSQSFPDAGLMPAAASPLDAARHVADLCFCSATLHPIVTRLRMPGFFAGPAVSAAVREKATTAMRDHFQLVEDRLGEAAWWYGDAWSAMDAYLGWVFWRVEGAGFPVVDYPRFAGHFQRLSARPSFERAMAIEANANAMLEAEGLAFGPAPAI